MGNLAQLKKARTQRSTSGFGGGPVPGFASMNPSTSLNPSGASEELSSTPQPPSESLEASEGQPAAPAGLSAAPVSAPLEAPVASTSGMPKSGGSKTPPLKGLLPMRAVIGTGRGDAMSKQSIAAERTVIKGAERAASDAHMKISAFWAKILTTPLPDGWWERTFVKYEQTPREFFELRHKAAGGRVQTTIMLRKSLKEALEQEMKELKERFNDFGPTSVTQVVEAHALVWAMITAGMDPCDI